MRRLSDEAFVELALTAYAAHLPRLAGLQGQLRAFWHEIEPELRLLVADGDRHSAGEWAITPEAARRAYEQVRELLAIYDASEDHDLMKVSA